MSRAEQRKRRSHAALEDTAASSARLTGAEVARGVGALFGLRPFSTESNRSVRCRVALRVKSSTPPPGPTTPGPPSLPSTSSPSLHPSPLSTSRPDMAQTPITAPAQRLMNYLASEWGGGAPAPASNDRNNDNNISPATVNPPFPLHPNRVLVHGRTSPDAMPAKRLHSPEAPVDLTHSPDSSSRPRRLRLRLMQQEASRRTSPAPIRVPPPGDSSEDEGDSIMDDEQPSAPPLGGEGLGGRGGPREARGKRPLQDDGDLDMEVTYGTAGPAQAKRSRISYVQYGLMDSPSETMTPEGKVDDPSLQHGTSRRLSAPPFLRDHLHSTARASSTPPALANTPPSGSFAAAATPNRPLNGAINPPSGLGINPPPGGLQSFVNDLLAQLPSSASNLQQHGTLLTNMLQGNIGIKPQLVVLQQALLELSDKIDDKSEHLMSSYAQLLQQYMGKERELEAAQAVVHERGSQLQEMENTIQQLQAALASAQAGAAASATALASAQREAEVSKEAFQQEVMCQICFERRKSVLLMPCLHFLYCQDCVARCFQQNTSRSCPTCRTAVAGTVNVHLQAS